MKFRRGLLKQENFFFSLYLIYRHVRKLGFVPYERVTNKWRVRRRTSDNSDTLAELIFRHYVVTNPERPGINYNCLKITTVQVKTRVIVYVK